jgi:hypothetical protein
MNRQVEVGIYIVSRHRGQENEPIERILDVSGQIIVYCYSLKANTHWGKERKSKKEPLKLIIVEEECPRIWRPGLG